MNELHIPTRKERLDDYLADCRRTGAPPTSERILAIVDPVRVDVTVDVHGSIFGTVQLMTRQVPVR